MNDLIERLEKATGPDRDLDRLIQLVDLGEPAHGPVPEFTASIDAALTLVPNAPERPVLDVGVPQKLHWMLVDNAYDEGYWQAGKAGAYIYDPILTPPRWKGYGATLAIALCIAALKARQSLQGEKP